MPAKKKPPTIITGQEFRGSTPLDEDDFAALSVDGFGSPASSLLASINWSGEIVAVSGLRLSPDNSQVLSSSVFLLGSLFSQKRVNITKAWGFNSNTYLSLTIPNANIFPFPNGQLYSDYVDSSACSLSFSQNGSEVSLVSLASRGYNGFSLRAHLAPISPTYTKLWITLFPLSKEDLLSSHPLASNPCFPGLKILEGDIPFTPLSSGPPLEKAWGFPFAPAILLGSELTNSSTLPSNASLIAALSATLRRPFRPEIYTTGAKLRARYEEILDQGSSQLKELSVEFLWPLPSASGLLGPTPGKHCKIPPPPFQVSYFVVNQANRQTRFKLSLT